MEAQDNGCHDDTLMRGDNGWEAEKLPVSAHIPPKAVVDPFLDPRRASAACMDASLHGEEACHTSNNTDEEHHHGANVEEEDPRSTDNHEGKAGSSCYQAALVEDMGSCCNEAGALCFRDRLLCDHDGLPGVAWYCTRLLLLDSCSKLLVLGDCVSARSVLWDQASAKRGKHANVMVSMRTSLSKVCDR